MQERLFNLESVTVFHIGGTNNLAMSNEKISAYMETQRTNQNFAQRFIKQNIQT